MTKNPTKEAYAELQQAYDYFNQALFSKQLPTCLITLQRKPRAKGYFSPNRFQHIENEMMVDEIAMNPDHFKTKSLPDVLSTLVHEMVHLQQAYFGKPSRKGYHNKEWATMMESVGLIPSETGKPGGNRVGQHMTHYIEIDGKFDIACKKLLDKNFRLSWADNFGDKKPKTKPGRIKYTCELCNINAWAKPGVNLACGDCNMQLISA